MKAIATLTLLISLLPFSVPGQTRSNIESKFGQPVNSYSVSEQIWMSPEYGSDGQVCRMTFHPKKFSLGTTYLSSELPFDQFRDVVDLIVPLAMRGARKEPFAKGGWETGAGTRWATFSYDHVTIVYSASFRVDVSKGLQRDFSFSPEATAQFKEQTQPDQDDFFHYHDSTAEVVTVVWKDRKCSEPR